MATLLPLLLLLLGSAGSCVGSFATDLQHVCYGHIGPEMAVQPHQCSEPPCNTTTTTLALALPLLLSLDISSMNSKLQLYNTAGSGCGLVRVWKTPDKVELEGAQCGEAEDTITVPHSPASGGGGWVHVVVVTEGQQVRLYLQGNKDTPLTLTCQPHLPYMVRVYTRGSRFGYSALNTTTTTTTPIPTTTSTSTPTTTTTTPSTTASASTTAIPIRAPSPPQHAPSPPPAEASQPLLVAITTLAAISVVVSVATLALMCWVWPRVAALLREKTAAHKRHQHQDYTSHHLL